MTTLFDEEEVSRRFYLRVEREAKKGFQLVKLRRLLVMQNN